LRNSTFHIDWSHRKRGLVFINQLICWYLFWSFFQDDKSRVEIFKEYAKKNKESVWVPFLHLLNRDDRFIVNQVINSLISQSSPESGAVLWRIMQFFYLICPQFRQKASSWINKTLLLVKQKKLLSEFCVKIQWHAHVECYRSWVRAQIGQNTIKFAFAASPLRPKKICVFTVTRPTLIFASDPIHFYTEFG
jgi:hypothetical protein